ncbi:MAG: hypothetical protein U0271_40960 [Polyangiaceae bacterium]
MPLRNLLGASTILLVGCSFLVDFPDVAGNGGGPNGGSGGTPIPMGGAPNGGSGGTGAGGNPDGGMAGAATGGGGGCALDPQSFVPDFDWTAQLGTATVDGYAPEVIAIDQDGDVWWAGAMSGGSLNAGGNPVVSTTGVSAGIWVLELDDTGKSKRGFLFGASSSTKVYDIAVLPNGHIALAGSFEGTIDFGDQEITSTQPDNQDPYNLLDGFVAVLDPDQGVVTHARAIGDGGYQEVTSIGADSTGALVVAAVVYGAIDWGDGPKANQGITLARLNEDLTLDWSREFTTGATTTASVAVVPGDDSIILGGATESAGALGQITPGEVVVGGYDAFVARYASDGKWMWHRLLGDDYYQAVSVTTVAPNRDILVAGTFLQGLKEHGTSTVFQSGATGYEEDDAFIARFDVDTGDTRWFQQIHGPSYQVVRDLKVDCGDRVIAVGSVHSPVSEGVDFGDGEIVQSTSADDYDDLFLASYQGDDGHLLFKKRVGDDYVEVFHRLELDAQGRVVMAGAFFFSIVLDPAIGGSMQSPGWDLFLARYNTNM